MADFHQEGLITTLHALHEGFDRETYTASLERKLGEYSRHQKITLLLPSLFSEIQNPQVLDRILDGIEKVNYVKRVVIALGGAPEEGQFQEAKAYFGRPRSSERDVKVVWVDGPRIQQILEQIQAREISTGLGGWTTHSADS
jgi:glucosyl-3-phosphoglycerate synthase